MTHETREDSSSTHRLLRKTSSAAGFQYEILEEVGRGGMGIVFKARHVALNKLVALKILPETHGFSRFKREAQILARLDHPNLIRVEDYGEAEGCPFFTMRLLKGRDLKGVLRSQRNGRLEPRVAAAIALKIARTLRHCHENGVLHRDVKPSNIFLEGDDPEHPILLDFGLAKDAEDSGESLTHSGVALGTLAYMSPEQMLSSGKVGPASDVWGLAATLYHLLTGSSPFPSSSMFEVYRRATQTELVSPAELNPATPLWLDALIKACLQPDPSLRPTLPDVIDQLEAGLREAPSRPERPRRLAPALIGACVGLAIGLAIAIFGAGAPAIVLDELWAPAITRESSVRIRGRAGSEALEVLVGGRALSFADGRFDVEVPVRGGFASLKLRRGSQERSWRLPIVIDRDPPEITLSNPGLGDGLLLAEGAIEGRVTDKHELELTLEGEVLEVDGRGRFRFKLEPGQRVRLAARDEAGHRTARVVTAARLHGPRGILGDAELWRGASQELQDKVIARAAAALRDAFDFEGTETFVFQETRTRLAVFRHRRSALIFHLIPGGAFSQGISDVEAEARFLRSQNCQGMIKYLGAALPPRRVRVPPLLIMKREVSAGGFARLMGLPQPSEPDRSPSLDWLALKPLLQASPELRLPSEAEWDYAARAGATTRFFWGDLPDPAYAWCDSLRDPARGRKQRRANAFGLLDTQGGCWEWVADVFVRDLKGLEGHGPRAPYYSGLQPGRIARGGSWQNPYASAAFSVRLVFNAKTDGLMTVRLAADIPWSEDSE